MDNNNCKWPKVVLYISLGLNICLVTGYLVIFHKLGQIKTPEGRMAMISHRLELTASQKAKLETMATEMREYRRSVRQKYTAEIAEFRSELVKPEPDYNKIAQLMDIAVMERSKGMSLLSVRIQEFMKGLNQQQRQGVVRRLDRLNKLLGE